MCGFGVGLSWGVCSANINVDDIYPIVETDEIFEEGIINSPADYSK
jgi:3-oxoacyl-[acyl-carrier-protein] synthase-3